VPPATESVECELTPDLLDAARRPSQAVSQETAFQDVFASLVWFPLPTKTLITIIIYTNIAMAILLFMLCIDEFAAGRRALFVLKQ